MKIFQQEVTVQAKDIDNLNHVNNVVYVQWVQDVASAHWNALSSSEQREKYSWVVIKHEIEYSGAAYLNDVLVVKTWVQESSGVRSERHVEFYHQKTNKLLVKAKTIWCMLDASTKRPHRVTQDIIEIFG